MNVLRNWLRVWLGIVELEQRFAAIERKLIAHAESMARLAALCEAADRSYRKWYDDLMRDAAAISEELNRIEGDDEPWKR